MKNTTLFAGTIAFASLLVATRSSGQTINANFVQVVPGLNVNGTIDDGGFTQLYTSGVMSFTNFQAFCIEPAQGLANGDMPVYEVQNPLTLDITNKVSRLVGAYLSLWGGSAPVTEQDKVDRSPDAAAIHWAIWEVTTETLGTYSLNDGIVRITGSGSDDTATITRANQFLSNINTYSPATVTFLTNPIYQDVVAWSLVPDQVPEPGSAGLLAFSSLLMLRRRRR
ncbi:MAG: PEP-CTERM sorting domain-containing protein [Verrucomicrobiota bacterium]